MIARMRSAERSAILIVEDHPLFAEAIAELLRARSRAYRIEICTSAAEALQAAATSTFWFRVLLDLDVPGAHGLSLVREFVQLGYASRSCVVAAVDRVDLAAELRALGLLGYIVKHLSVAAFSDALDRVVRGEHVFPDHLRDGFQNAVRLTRRQQQLLEYLEEGLSSKEMASELGISEGTVNNYITGLLRVLSVTNRAQAVARGIELGFIGLAGRQVVEGATPREESCLLTTREFC
ncbi:MAG TPA: response regulator transcription factor [Burkholderiaceae bacterium]|nr:response regulator transcription factor [Burkholderiaceae bacterium]